MYIFHIFFNETQMYFFINSKWSIFLSEYNQMIIVYNLYVFIITDLLNFPLNESFIKKKKKKPES